MLYYQKLLKCTTRGIINTTKQRMENVMQNLLDMTQEEIEDIVIKLGYAKFHAKQIFSWLHKGVTQIQQMTNLSKQFRNELEPNFCIHKLEIVRKIVSKIDQTTKYVFKLYDGNIIESVLMKYSTGFSLCISSQVGCKMGCKFCASSYASFVRDLTAGEMLDQIITTNHVQSIRIRNVVIMGIGEPLDNYDNVYLLVELYQR